MKDPKDRDRGAKISKIAVEVQEDTKDSERCRVVKGLWIQFSMGRTSVSAIRPRRCWIPERVID